MANKDLGFIGLGNMGAPMASRLLDAGFSLTVFDTRAAALEPFVARGAIAAPSPAATPAPTLAALTGAPPARAMPTALPVPTPVAGPAPRAAPVPKPIPALQPVFLINALDKVEQMSVIRPSLIPGMIKKLKNLLLYVIYDNNQASASLEKELSLLEEYIGLEKSGNPDNFRVMVKIIGNPSGERIAPFIILPLVENGFRQLSSLDMPEKCMDLEVRVDDGHFNMKLGWSKPIDSSTLMNGNTLSLQHIGRRLDLLYPESHELKVTITTEQFIVNLKINLNRAIT